MDQNFRVVLLRGDRAAPQVVDVCSSYLAASLDNHHPAADVLMAGLERPLNTGALPRTAAHAPLQR